jgi:4'-phosphopantetheinyl transferase
VARVLGVGSETVVIERRCERCGGEHGRPLVAAPAGGDRAQVSLSRAGDTVAVAVTFAGPVGIDIESIRAVSLAPLDSVAFGPGERSALPPGAGPCADRARASLWTCKEAVLKAAGLGLRTDPRELTVSLPGPGDIAQPTLDGWPGAPFAVERMRLLCLAPGPGLVGTVAVLAGARPVTVREVRLT